MADFRFRRGDVVWYNDPEEFCPDCTYVLHGTHPAVIVSPDSMNINAETIVVAPMTSNTNRRLYDGQFDIFFNGRISRVRCDQLRVVDKRDLDLPCGHIATELVPVLNKALAYVTGMTESPSIATEAVIQGVV